jgi:hypothetical protein
MKPAAPKSRVGSRVLSSFANALLDRGMPRIKAWLRERLGDDADLDSLRVDGTKAHLSGVRLPFGKAVLQLSHATLALDGNSPSSPRVRLVALEGTLSWGDDFAADLRLTSTRTPREFEDYAWVDGTLTVDAVRWRQRHGLGDAEPIAGTIDVAVTMKRWRLSNGQFEGTAAALWLEAEGAMDNSEGRGLDRAKLVFKEVRAGHLVDAITAVTDGELSRELRLPWSARMTGSLAWSQSGRLELTTSLRDPQGHLPDELRMTGEITLSESEHRGSVRLESAASLLELSLLSLVADDDSWRLDGSKLQLRVALGDLATMRLFESIDPRWRPDSLGTLRGDLELSGPASDPRCHGPVELDRIVVGAEGPTSTDLSGNLELSKSGAITSELRAQIWGTTLHGCLAYSFDAEPTKPLFEGKLVDASAGMLQDMAKIGGGDRGASARPPRRLVVAHSGKRPADESWLSADAKISGELAVQPDGATSGSLALQSRDSAVLLSLSLDAHGGLAGTRFAGRVGLHDALLLGLFAESATRPLPEGSVKLDANLKGSLAKPELSGTIRSGPLVVDAGWALLDVNSVHLFFVLDPSSLVYRDLIVEAYGGRIEGEGLVGLSEAFDGIDSELVLRDLYLEQIPLDRGPRRLGAELLGRARGEVHLRRRSAVAPMIVRGQLTVHEPDFVALAKLGPAAKQVGLPLPPTRGVRPLEAAFEIDGEHLTVSDLVAEVDGCKLAGGGQLNIGEGIGAGKPRGIAGEAMLHLSRRYLSRSVLLTLPTWFTGDLAVPVTFAGTTTQPTVDADVAGAMRRAFAKGPVGGMVSDVSQGLSDAVGGMLGAVDGLMAGASGSAAKRGATGDAELDALVDRIMRDDPDTERLIDALIEAGVTSDDIVRVLERRRLRF